VFVCVVFPMRVCVCVVCGNMPDNIPVSANVCVCVCVCVACVSCVWMCAGIVCANVADTVSVLL